MTTNVIPSPVTANGLVYVMSGFRGAALQAIRLEGAKGYLGDTDCVQWTHDRNTPYTPSGLLYDGLLYFTRVNTGVLSCLEAADGTVHYEGARLEGVRELYASPVGADGRVYIPSREGVTSVIQAGKEFKLLATNKLDDCFDASPVVVGKELYLRGKNLYCLAED